MIIRLGLFLPVSLPKKEEFNMKSSYIPQESRGIKSLAKRYQAERRDLVLLRDGRELGKRREKTTGCWLTVLIKHVRLCI